MLCSNIPLVNRIAVPIPNPQNIKHTPLFWFENDLMKKYLQNSDLLHIWNIIKEDELSNSNIWLTLADKAIKGVFDNNSYLLDYVT